MPRRFPRSPRRVSNLAIDRRSVLRALGGLAGAAAVAPLVKGCGNVGIAAAPTLRPEDLDIDTIIILMMENRSFDHMFGARSLEEGLRVEGLRPGLSNPRADGTVIAPFHMADRCVFDPPHGWNSTHAQIGDGANAGFVTEYEKTLGREGHSLAGADRVMGYHGRAELPFYYGLADEFALCDRWFASVPGPTWPNRYYLHSGQANGRTNNSPPEDLQIGFTWPTIWDRLDTAGIPWKAYWSDLSFLVLWGRHRPKIEDTKIEQFYDDARSGRLPAVCSVEPTYFGVAANDDHPPHDFVRGQAFVSSVIRAVAEGPQWNRSLILVTYDEHGGFYDHVAPPTVEDERAAEGFDDLGVRVPGLVISPWTRRGHVSSVTHEHSSFPALLGWLFGLEPLTVRDAQANFFLDTFDVDRIRRADPRAVPPLPLLEVDTEVPAECLEAVEASGGRELAAFADAAGLGSALDQRGESVERLQRVYRTLIELGGARPLARR